MAGLADTRGNCKYCVCMTSFGDKIACAGLPDKQRGLGWAQPRHPPVCKYSACMTVFGDKLVC